MASHFFPEQHRQLSFGQKNSNGTDQSRPGLPRLSEELRANKHMKLLRDSVTSSVKWAKGQHPPPLVAFLGSPRSSYTSKHLPNRRAKHDPAFSAALCGVRERKSRADAPTVSVPHGNVWCQSSGQFCDEKAMTACSIPKLIALVFQF